MVEVSEWNRKIVDEFRANKGKLGGPFEGAPVLLLHTTGAKTGEERLHPVMYLRLDDSRVAVFASKAGAPTNPDWYHNLTAHPGATVEIGEDTIAVTARQAPDDERTPIWEKQKTAYPNFAEYEKNTDRQIPVMILERTS